MRLGSSRSASLPSCVILGVLIGLGGAAVALGAPPATETSPRAEELDPQAVGGGSVDHVPPFDPRIPYRMIARSEAKRLDIPYEWIDAIIAVESGYNPLATGHDGEVGLMQIMPQTARLLGFKGTNQELSDPQINIRLGADYLAEAYRLAQGDLCTTVMKYRAGHQETRFSQRSVDYCVKVRRHLVALDLPVAGEVPAATFGFWKDRTRMGTAIGSVAAARRHATGSHLRSRVGWSAYAARLQALDAKARRISLD